MTILRRCEGLISSKKIVWRPDKHKNKCICREFLEIIFRHFLKNLVLRASLMSKTPSPPETVWARLNFKVLAHLDLFALLQNK